jgi:hypothetical protein
MEERTAYEQVMKNWDLFKRRNQSGHSSKFSLDSREHVLVRIWTRIGHRNDTSCVELYGCKSRSAPISFATSRVA